MKTIIRLKPDELTPSLIERIKAFFGTAEELEIALSPVSDFGLNQKESKEEYINRVNKAIENLQSNKDPITFSIKKT